MADDMTIPKANIVDFPKEKIIKSKEPLTKDRVDTQCRAGAMLRGIPSSVWSGVELGTTQEKSSIFNKTPETIYNYGCREMNLDEL